MAVILVIFSVLFSVCVQIERCDGVSNSSTNTSSPSRNSNATVASSRLQVSLVTTTRSTKGQASAASTQPPSAAVGVTTVGIAITNAPLVTARTSGNVMTKSVTTALRSTIATPKAVESAAESTLQASQGPMTSATGGQAATEGGAPVTSVRSQRSSSRAMSPGTTTGMTVQASTKAGPNAPTATTTGDNKVSQAMLPSPSHSLLTVTFVFAVFHFPHLRY